MKILNKFATFLLLFTCVTANALDLSKVRQSDIIGGNPYTSARQNTAVANSTHTKSKPTSIKSYRGSSHEQALDSQIRNYQTSRKKNSIINKYRGSSHERALDAQIRNYRASARENERVFGAPFRTTTNKKLPSKLEDLLARGILKIIVDKNGQRKLVDNR